MGSEQIGSDGSPIGPSRCLVSSREVIQCMVEEVSNLVVEFLDRVEFDGHQFVRGDPITGEGDKAVFTDESAEMLLCKDHAVDQLAQGNALAKALSSPVLVLLPHRVFVRITDPLPQILIEGGHARLEFALRDLTEGTCAFIRQDVLHGLTGQRKGVSLDQLD